MEQNEALVKQNDVEKALAKLGSFKEDNLMAKKKAELDEIYECFTRRFDYFLTRISAGESRNQFFNAKERRILADVIARQVKPWAITQIIFFAFSILPLLTAGVASILCGCPGFFVGILMFYCLVGWFVPTAIIEDAESWHYLHYRKILKKAYGENYFPRDYLG